MRAARSSASGWGEGRLWGWLNAVHHVVRWQLKLLQLIVHTQACRVRATLEQ